MKLAFMTLKMLLFSSLCRISIPFSLIRAFNFLFHFFLSHEKKKSLIDFKKTMQNIFTLLFLTDFFFFCFVNPHMYQMSQVELVRRLPKILQILTTIEKQLRSPWRFLFFAIAAAALLFLLFFALITVDCCAGWEINICMEKYEGLCGLLTTRKA